MTKITEGHKLYAVTIRNHAYALVGPFESYETLSMWGDQEAARGDDPRWQSVELRDDALMPAVHSGDWHFGYTP